MQKKVVMRSACSRWPIRPGEGQNSSARQDRPVAQGQTSYYRNSEVGQWRYYRLWPEMNTKTVDWDAFLGHGVSITGDSPPLGPKIPFDRAVFAQWRCYWPFGGGMFTDLFVHQTTHLIAAMGLRHPARVVGGGGLYPSTTAATFPTWPPSSPTR
jgi:hypothetical protein